MSQFISLRLSLILYSFFLVFRKIFNGLTKAIYVHKQQKSKKFRGGWESWHVSHQIPKPPLASLLECPVLRCVVLSHSFRIVLVLTGCFSSIVCGNHLFADLTDVQFSLTCPVRCPSKTQPSSNFLPLCPHPPYPRGQKIAGFVSVSRRPSLLSLLIENVRRTQRKSSRNWTTPPTSLIWFAFSRPARRRSGDPVVIISRRQPPHITAYRLTTGQFYFILFILLSPYNGIEWPANTYASYFHLLAQFACRLLFALCYFNQVPGDATRDSIEGLLCSPPAKSWGKWMLSACLFRGAWLLGVLCNFIHSIKQ